MDAGTSESVSVRRQRLAFATCVAAALVCALAGLSALAGWQYRINLLKAPLGPTPMTPAAGLSFVLFSLVLLIKSNRDSGMAARVLANVTAGILAVFAAATLFEYASGIDLHIDTLLFAHRMSDWNVNGPPGRYALPTALCFLLGGIGLLFVDVQRSETAIHEVCAAGILLVSFTGLLGYAYKVQALYALGNFVAPATHTVMVLAVLGVGILLVRPQNGIAALMISEQAPGIMARRLLVATITIVPLLGWAHIKLQRYDLVDAEFGIALLVMGCVLVFGVMIVNTAHVLYRLQEARERAVAALRESEERIRIATSAADMGVWMWDLETDEMFLSEKAKQLFGVASWARKITNDFIERRIHPEDRERLVTKNARLVEPGLEYANEYRIMMPDGNIRWVAVKGRRFDRPSPRVIGVISDITDRKSADAALIRSEKLASVGRMAATIAHEINNPLAAVTNILYLVAQDPTLSSESRKLVQVAEEELGRVTHITKQTLGFYRERAAPTSVKVTDLIESVRELYARRLEHKGVRVHLRIRAPEAIVQGIFGELRQVLSNLVANSIDALPKKGDLHLGVATVAGKVRITVADNGEGILPANRKRMFEPFFTTKEAVGTGLGLWVSKEIVSSHRGKIRLKSQVGKGTVFCVYLDQAEIAQPVPVVAQGSSNA